MSNRIADNIQHYAAVLNDLKTERDSINSQINWIELRLQSLKAQVHQVPITGDPIQPLFNPGTMNTQERRPFQPMAPGQSLADQCYLILEESGTPLHAKAINKKLPEYGRVTTVKSISGVMPGDKKHRFENLGSNVWALAKWSESIKAPYRAPKIDN